MQVSEAGDLKRLMIHMKVIIIKKCKSVKQVKFEKRPMIHQVTRIRKCKLVKQVIQKRLMIHKKVVMIKNVSEAGDLKEANDLLADDDKEMQVSEAGEI